MAAENSNYTIDVLYAICDDLTSAKDKIGEHEQKFQNIIQAAKSSQDVNVKKLASQLIGRFFKHFPNLHTACFDVFLDLCEDDDVNVRKQSIKDLPNLCKDNKEHTHRVADVLSQLMQTEDQQELNITMNSLISVITSDPARALGGIFYQINIGDDLLKERCFKFFSTKFKVLLKEVINKEAENVILEFSKKFMVQANVEEFKVILQILSQTQLGKTVIGQREIVSIIEKFGELNEPFPNPNFDLKEATTILIIAIRSALPYLSSQISSNNFVRFICEKVLQHFDKIKDLPQGETTQVELFENLAELAAFVTNYDEIETNMLSLYNFMLDYLPLPPEELDPNEHPEQELTFVECLLFTFFKLCKLNPKFLSENEERLKDFRKRLIFFSRGVRGFSNSLNEKKLLDEGLKQNKSLPQVIKMAENIETLIKAFHRDEKTAYKTIIVPSWLENEKSSKKATKPESQKIDSNASESKGKKHQPITFDKDESSPAKKANLSNDQQQIYTPPSGKYSNKLTNNFEGKRTGGNNSNGRSRSNIPNRFQKRYRY